MTSAQRLEHARTLADTVRNMARETILPRYLRAVRERYRFFSYGDAMLLQRAAPAVPSGLSVMERSPLSLKVYISFCTMSVVSPTPRRNSSVCSNTGVRTSRKPASAAAAKEGE